MKVWKKIIRMTIIPLDNFPCSAMVFPFKGFCQACIMAAPLLTFLFLCLIPRSDLQPHLSFLSYFILHLISIVDPLPHLYTCIFNLTHQILHKRKLPLFLFNLNPCHNRRPRNLPFITLLFVPMIL